jgi:RNA polymerase sigma-70 factor (ECF subfamily)
MSAPAELALSVSLTLAEPAVAVAVDDPVLVALVRRAQVGDRAAFAGLLQRCQAKVFAVCRRFLRDPEEALDATQETFLRVHKYLRSYDPDKQAFGAWVYTIAVNVCRSGAARRARAAATSARLATAPEADPGARDPEMRAMAVDEERRLGQALDTLTEKERAAFVLRDLEGLPTEEVARILGASPVTVRVHICAARKKMKRFLAEAHGEGAR